MFRESCRVHYRASDGTRQAFTVEWETYGAGWRGSVATGADETRQTIGGRGSGPDLVALARRIARDEQQCREVAAARAASRGFRMLIGGR